MKQMPGHSFVRALLDEGVPPIETISDWEALRCEGLLGLAADHCLRHHCPLPEAQRVRFLQAVAFEMRCGVVLTEISEAAQTRGLSTLTFKGCALAFGLYPRAGQRAFGDIDVAIPAQNWKGMVEVLLALGFTHSLECLFSRDGVEVDLHRHPLHQLADLVGPPCQEWWDQAQPLSDRTGPALRLAHEHEFVLALFHGAKHSFSRAGWVVDLALLSQTVDSERLAEAVRRFRAQRQLAYATKCLNRWFGQTLPAALVAVAPPRWNFLERRFVHLVLARKAPDFLGMLTPLSSAPNLWSALRYLLQTLYPAGVPRWQRSKQLLAMARMVGKA